MTQPLQQGRRPQKTTSGACLRYKGGVSEKGREGLTLWEVSGHTVTLEKHVITGRGAVWLSPKIGIAVFKQ